MLHVLSLAGVAACLIGLGVQGRESPMTPQAPPAAREAAPEPDYSADRARAPSPPPGREGRGESMQRATSVVPVARDGPEDESPKPMDAAQEAAKQKFIADQLQTQFEADAAPTRASMDAAGTLRESFAALEDQGVSAVNVECRQRICRIELKLRDLTADIKAFDELLSARSALSRFGGMMALPREIRPDGARSTVVYLAQQGEIEIFE